VRPRDAARSLNPISRRMLIYARIEYARVAAASRVPACSTFAAGTYSCVGLSAKSLHCVRCWKVFEYCQCVVIRHVHRV
jgi:hypothetical protein